MTSLIKSSALVQSLSNVYGSAPITFTPWAGAISCWARGAAGIPPGTPPPGGPPPDGPPGPPSVSPPGGPVRFIPFWNFVAISVDDKVVVPLDVVFGMVVVWVVVVVAIAILASTCCSGMSSCMGLFLISWLTGSSPSLLEDFSVLICTNVSGSSSSVVSVSSRLTSHRAVCSGSSSLS